MNELSARVKADLRWNTLRAAKRLSDEQFQWQLHLCREWIQDIIMEVMYIRGQYELSEQEDSFFATMMANAKATYFKLLWALGELNKPN